MTVISQLAEFVAHASTAALTHAERELQHRHVLDTVVAAVAGAQTGEAKSLAALMRQRALPERIGQRAATIRLSEVDDIHLVSCTTPSATAVAVALSLAEHLQRFDPVEVASAIWVGTELMTRMGEAVRGPEILYRGVWPSCFAAPLSAAATAARLHRLDASRAADALSLAMMLATRGTGRPHGSPSARWVMFAMAVAAGLSAVAAVETGYRGDPALLDGCAFEDAWGFALDRDRLAAITPRRSCYPALSLKPFCSAKQSIAAVEALRMLLASGIKPDAIAAVRVKVPPAYLGMISLKAQDQVRTTTLVSAARQLALLAIDPERLYDVDRSRPMIAKERVAELEAKITIVAEPALACHYPRSWPAEVEVLSTDGGTLRELVVAAPGDPERALDAAAVDNKAHHLLDGLIGVAAATELIDIAGRGLESEADCRALAAKFAQMSAAVGAKG
ncbi:MAG TPA: MmgE/PrpD family protein [Xanthobacteraceae bacterium]|jgi:2-methylcitrate dehydratase PrpD|nr:MmgE/PrpD family protein [Xanthobacteraceae bacterium]